MCCGFVSCSVLPVDRAIVEYSTRSTTVVKSTSSLLTLRRSAPTLATRRVSATTYWGRSCASACPTATAADTFDRLDDLATDFRNIYRNVRHCVCLSSVRAIPANGSTWESSSLLKAIARHRAVNKTLCTCLASRASVIFWRVKRPTSTDQNSKVTASDGLRQCFTICYLSRIGLYSI